jgi:hypothetical protein
MLTGRYRVEIACDHPGCKRFMVYEGHDGKECTRKARTEGWRLYRDGSCACPQCAKSHLDDLLPRASS